MTTGAQALGATALLEQAARLDEEAREHKRAEAFHRRKARDARRSIAEIEAECRRLGIRFVLQPRPQSRRDTDR